VKLKAMAVGIGALTVLGMGSGAAFAGAPSPTQSATISLDPSLPQGVDTGFVVNKVQSVGVTATGIVGFAGGCGSFCSTNPDGVFVDPTTGTVDPGPITVTCGPGCQVDGANVGRLVGRIGTTGPWFPIGSSGTVTYQGKVGELYVAYNDGYFADNVGSYTVSLTRH
jgi:hypothetical protein